MSDDSEIQSTSEVYSGTEQPESSSMLEPSMNTVSRDEPDYDESIGDEDDNEEEEQESEQEISEDVDDEGSASYAINQSEANSDETDFRKRTEESKYKDDDKQGKDYFSLNALKPGLSPGVDISTPGLLLGSAKQGGTGLESISESQIELEVQDEDKIVIDVYKSALCEITAEVQAKPDMKNAGIISMELNKEDEESEEEEVYPLSIKYDKFRARKNMIIRYILLAIIIILLIPTDVYTFGIGRTLPFRIGYFADEITEKSFSISGTDEFKFDIDNCRIYLLENTGSISDIDLYISAKRDTSMSFDEEDGVRTIKINSSDKAPV